MLILMFMGLVTNTVWAEDKGSERKNNADPLLVESLTLLRTRDRMNIASPDIQKQIRAFYSVDITKPWTEENVITFPSFSGELKEDAKAGRKRVVQNAVRIAYNRLLFLTFFNARFLKVLDTKMPLRLPSEKATKICDALKKSLREKFDMDEIDSTYWAIRLKGGGTNQNIDCPNAVGLEDYHDDDKAYLRELLKDKFSRMKLAQFLLATALKVDVQRVSNTQIKVKSTLDFNQFFANYKFAPLDTLVEK